MSDNNGKILRVDLTTGVISQEDADKYEERFIGGRGVGSWILFNEMSPKIKPDDPESVIVIDTGPLSGIFPSSGRISVAAKNCMTGGVNWSNAGGSFGSELRRTGWYHIVIKGKSEEPVYLHIKDDNVELRSAAHLWGTDVWDTENIICDELGDPKTQTFTIGPAGENLVPMAILISNRTRAAGGGGVGGIFGSKNLKAIAVRGTKEIPIADHGKFKAIAEKVNSKLKNSQFTGFMADLDCFGTYMAPMNNLCAYPFRNTEDDHFENLDESSVALNEWLELRTGKIHNPCYACPINCGGHILEAKKGPFKGLKIGVPENNTFYAYATRLNMRSPSNILKAFELLSRYGLDQDAVGVVISWAFECYEKGILTKKDTDWLDLTWGNDLAVIALIRKIAYKDGFGELLSKGCKRASEIIGKGSDYYCIHLKGQDNLDALRALKAWGFGNVVSLRGGRHLDGAPTTEFFPDTAPEVGEKLFGVKTAFQPTTYEGKGKLVAWTSRYKSSVDTTGVCYFATYWGSIEHMGPEDFAEALSAATGKKRSTEDFLKIGERILNIEKAFNTLHAGFTRKDDYPPSIYMKEPIKTGQFKGELITKEGQDEMLNEFYEAHGWDKESSWQYKERLIELELPEVIEKLKEARKLL